MRDYGYHRCQGKDLPQSIKAGIIEANQETFAWSPAMTEADFNLTYGVYYYLDLEGRVLAFINGHILMGEGEIIQVWVDPSLRGQGLASYLFDQVQADLTINKLFLEARETNYDAINLYKAKSFVEIDRRPNYYQHPQEDAVMMLWERREEHDLNTCN